jgi:hypothetical protein
MAKPPSDKNMATGVPVSQPDTSNAPGKTMKAVDKIVVPGTKKPAVPSGQRDYKVSTKANVTTFEKKPEKKPEIKKGVMADIQARQAADMGGPAAVPAKKPAPMPTQAQHAQRAANHGAAMAGEFQPKGPVSSGLELAGPKAAGIAVKKPGIFGRLNKATLSDIHANATAPKQWAAPTGPKVNMAPPVVAPLPKLTPVGQKMHTVGTSGPDSTNMSGKTQPGGPAQETTAAGRPSAMKTTAKKQ